MNQTAPSSGELSEPYASIAKTFFASKKTQEVTLWFIGAALAFPLAGAGCSIYRTGRYVNIWVSQRRT